MFENANTTVDKGSVGLAAAIFQYKKLGYNILIPLIDNQGYDLAIERGGLISTVQVKTTAYRRSEKYVVQLRRIRPNRSGNKILPLEETDIVFVLCEDGSCYSIPYANVTTKSELRLNEKFDKFQINVGDKEN